MPKGKFGYVKGVFIWLDQGFNVIFRWLLNKVFNTTRFGYVDETISSVLGKESRDGCKTCKVICGILSFILRDPNHCKTSIEEDEGEK